MAKFEMRRYIVVCKNERQAKLIFERLYAYWKSRGAQGRHYLLASTNELMVRDPLCSVRVVTERKMCELSDLLHGYRVCLYSGRHVDRWLDRKEKRDD